MKTTSVCAYTPRNPRLYIRRQCLRSGDRRTKTHTHIAAEPVKVETSGAEPMCTEPTCTVATPGLLDKSKFASGHSSTTNSVHAKQVDCYKLSLARLPILYVRDIPELLENPLLRAFLPQHANVSEENLSDVQPVTHSGLHARQFVRNKQSCMTIVVIKS